MSVSTSSLSDLEAKDTSGHNRCLTSTTTLAESKYPSYIHSYIGGSGPTETMAPTVKAKPREYKEGEDFNAYLNHFNRIATAMEWTDPVKLVQLETVLRGKAQREFEVFIEENSQITWDDMVKKLKEELVPSKQKSLDYFQNMRLGDKSPKEFYAALVRQSKLAHGEMAEEARHAIVKAQLLQGIPKQLRIDAGKQKELSSLDKDALLELLTRVFDADLRDSCDDWYEPIVGKVQASNYRSVGDRLTDLEEKFSSHNKDMAELKGLVTDLCSGLKQVNFQPRNDRRGQSQGQTRCYRCQEMGHFARSCTNREKCNFCQRQGHRYASCPDKPKN